MLGTFVCFLGNLVSQASARQKTVRKLEVLCLGTDQLHPQHLFVVMEAGTSAQ